MSRRRRSYRAWNSPPLPARAINRCVALLVIDNRPLQAAAWSELVASRRRLEKATADVHRHEEKDRPAFQAWLAGAFPVLLSQARDLGQQVEAKGRLIDRVESESFVSGRRAAQIWREWQQSGGPSPDEPEASAPTDDSDAATFEEEMRWMFEEEGLDEDDPMAEEFRRYMRAGLGREAVATEASTECRSIYRRLVRQLHPDCGGVWDSARARLWEQVQAAWTTRDSDWLSRLEAEWETAADLLGPASPLGRLRVAREEIEAARRDAEKRVRAYRKEPIWRFTLQPLAEKLRMRVQRDLAEQVERLREELEEIEATIADWERFTPNRRKNRRGRVAKRRGMQQEMPF